MQRNGSIAIRNARIITMDPNRPFAESLAVKSGEIVAIGPWDRVAPVCEGLRPLDLKGNSVLPGMIDTHTHFLWTALHAAAVDLEDVHDHQSLKEVIDAAVAQASRGEPVLAMGYTEYPLEAKGLGPILAELDTVAPQNPVFLIGVTGHSSAVNPRALEILDLPRIGGVHPPGWRCRAAHGRAARALRRRSHVFGYAVLPTGAGQRLRARGASSGSVDRLPRCGRCSGGDGLERL